MTATATPDQPIIKKPIFDIETIFGKSIEEVDKIIADKEKYIQRIEIPKKDGSKRKVVAPGNDLKYIQKSLYWRFFRKYKPHNAAHGFVAKRGISTNADAHVGAKSMLKVDISNFFDSITIKHLENCLFGNKHVCRGCSHYNRMLDGKCNPSLYKNKEDAKKPPGEREFSHRCEEIKGMFVPGYSDTQNFESTFRKIIEVCTFEGFTAQGFPTSPVIANIVLKGFDRTMTRVAEDINVNYTRYADDLAFSSRTHTKEELKTALLRTIYRQLWAYGFEPNKKKTMAKSSSGRLKICGVVVNVKKNIPRKDFYLFKAKVHHAIVKFPEKTTKTRMRELKGYASFIMSINHEKGSRYMKKLIDFEKIKFKK